MKYERTQEDGILAILESRGSEWTPAPDLARISLQYGRAIYVLRKRRGIAIENKVEIVDGVRHGFFRLAPSPRTTVTKKSLADETPSLFGDLHRDDG
jgi:hypothetical protein